MNKIFSLSILCGLFFCGCVDPIPSTPKNDSAKTNSPAPAVHSVTIDNPLDKTPHAVKDSIYNGEHVERYPNGVIYMSGQVEGGLRTGQWLTFYQSGKPWSQGVYKNGLRQGHGISWYENGNKSSEGEYKDDRPVGKWTYWDENGNAMEKDFGQ